MDDEVTSLVRRVQGRDLAAFDQLVRRFQGRALAYARSLLREGADAEDAAQDAFVLLWRELPSLREPAAFPSFLRRLVFKCADRIRRRPSVRGISFDPAGHADGAELSGGSDPVFGVIRSDEGRRVRDAVLALPEAERQAAMLYYFGEHDLAAIADFLGVPRTTVKNRLHAARKRLRKELWDMSEEAMSRRTRSSRGDAFTRSVLVRAVDEYRRQKHADPHVADRELLRAGREALEESLAGSGPLDDEDARAGFHLLTPPGRPQGAGPIADALPRAGTR